MKNTFVSSVKTIAQSLIDKAGFDKTRSGKIVAKNDMTNTYSVRIDGNIYANVRVVNDAVYNVGDTVKVNMPCNQPTQMVIVSSIFSDASIGKKIGHAEKLIDAIDGSLEDVKEIDGHIYQLDIVSVFGASNATHTGHIYKDGVDVTDSTYWSKFKWYLMESSGKTAITDSISNATLTMALGTYLYGMALILEWVDDNNTVLLRKRVILIDNDEVSKVMDKATNAYNLADNTDNYFWMVESGTDTGAHITNVQQDTFLAATTDAQRGYNLLAKPNGIALRYGYTELGHFTQTSLDFQAYQNGTLYKTAELTPSALTFYNQGYASLVTDANGVSMYTASNPNVQLANFSANGITFNDAVPAKIGNANRYLQWTGSALNIVTDQLHIGNDDISTTISQAANAQYRGSCATAASTAAKTVACAGFDLVAGASIAVYMTTAQTNTGGLTLNVNNTGAKNIYVDGSVTSSSNKLLWDANSVVTFMYSGSYWNVADNGGTWYGSTCSNASATSAKTSTVNGVVIFKGTSVVVPMTYDNTSTSATLNISSLGAANIYYGNTSTAPTTANEYGWMAGATVAFTFDGQYWRLDDASASQKASNAAKVATNYLDYSDNDGVTVGYSGLNSKVNISGNGINLYNENGVVGTSISASGMNIYSYYSGTRYNAGVYDRYGLTIYGYDNNAYGVEIAKIYSGNGNAESGTQIRPYYTFGRRKSGSAIGNWSFAGGTDTTASGYCSHAEGDDTVASGMYSHAEGDEATASGRSSHAEGWMTTASGNYSHAEGYRTTASLDYSHAEGGRSTASGEYSHAEGGWTKASGDYSHAGGFFTTADYDYQTVIGRYNANSSDNVFEIGNGSSASYPRNAFSVALTGRTIMNATDYENHEAEFVIQLQGTKKLMVGIGTGGKNHGLWSEVASKWLIYSDGSTSPSKTFVGRTENDDNRFCPQQTNNVYLGEDTHRWKKVYSASADDTSSDRKIKDNIKSIEYAKDFIMNLKPVEFQMKDSDHRRTHMGFIAQDVAEVGKILNKNLSVYSAYYIDETKGEYLGESVPDEELSWGIAYTEIIAPLVKVVQEQQIEINKLKRLYKGGLQDERTTY